MRLISILLCMIVHMFFIPKSYAQEKTPKTPGERAAAITEWMKTNLQLTPEQEGTVQSINLKFANVNEGLKNSNQSRMQKFKTLKSSDQAKDKELKAILTDEQFKIYQSKKDELRKKFKEEAKSRREGL